MRVCKREEIGFLVATESPIAIPGSTDETPEDMTGGELDECDGRALLITECVEGRVTIAVARETIEKTSLAEDREHFEDLNSVSGLRKDKRVREVLSAEEVIDILDYNARAKGCAVLECLLEGLLIELESEIESSSFRELGPTHALEREAWHLP